jgi:transcriptional regulator GlxA family with amidase domain
MPPKRIAFLIFPRVTLLDFIGAYDSLRRIAAMAIDPGVTHRVIGTDPEIVDESGLSLKPDSVYEDLSKFDLLYVSGGLGTVALMDNKRAVDYLKTWGDERPLASVCSGSLLLGSAGYLRDKRATTHHQAVELLRPLCREVVTNRRVVDEGARGDGGRRLVVARPRPLSHREVLGRRRAGQDRRPDGVPRLLPALSVATVSGPGTSAAASP